MMASDSIFLNPPMLANKERSFMAKSHVVDWGYQIEVKCGHKSSIPIMITVRKV